MTQLKTLSNNNSLYRFKTLLFMLCAATLLNITITLNVDAKETVLKKAYFAGGCFWCVESNYENVHGVVEVISGYTGGQLKNPTYQQVSAGKTAHL